MLNKDKPSLRGKICIKGEPIVIAPDIYTGPYNVTPNANTSETLLTKNKLLTENVEVEKIPYREYINQSGLTAIIAEED